MSPFNADYVPLNSDRPSGATSGPLLKEGEVLLRSRAPRTGLNTKMYTMGKKQKTRNNLNFVGVWLSQDEHARMLADMEGADITTKANYLRECLFHGRVRVKRKTAIDDSVRTSINAISDQIGRIGNNYNQIVRRVNGMTRTSKKDGSPEISSRQLGFYLGELREATEEVVSLQKQLIDMIAPFISKTNQSAK